MGTSSEIFGAVEIVLRYNLNCCQIFSKYSSMACNTILNRKKNKRTLICYVVRSIFQY